MPRGAIILMYHAIGATDERPSRYVVPVRRLEQQLRLLVRLGFRVVPLEEMVEALRDGRVPRRAVALTFDDGHLDNRTLAYPLLVRFGLPATFFIVSRRSGNDWSRSAPLDGRPLLRVDQLRELAPLVTIGAHTRTHPALTSLSLESAKEEIAGSRADLEEALGVPVTFFAYPYGLFDPGVRSLAEEAGFLAACSVISGRNTPATDRFALRRLEIDGTYSLARFAATLGLGDTHLRERWRGRRGRSAGARGGVRGVG
jgi:peptidoglycan/xylan/chitin deacetylase (PgdA/CDA1 family)